MAPDTTDAAQDAWLLLSRIAMARRGHLRDVAAAFDLSPPQMWALRHLEPGTPMPMGALAELLQCDNSNVTGIVDRLERRGLVERRAATHDRRVKHLEVTEEGAALRAAVGARLQEPPPGFVRLTDDELRLLATLLRKVAD